MKTIFLDFDGVLFDSVKEAYLLARYAYYDIPVKAEIDDNHYNLFKKYRYLITHSWHYYYILDMLESYSDVVCEAFENLYWETIQNRKEDKDVAFDKKYQSERQRLIKEENEYWETLDIPYQFFYAIKEIQGLYDINILSTKNEYALLKHLQDYDFLIDKNKVIGKETLSSFENKADFIQKYMQLNKVAKAVFIDDSLNNLNECKNIKNLTCIHAKWGYVSPVFAQENSFEVINIIKEL